MKQINREIYLNRLLDLKGTPDIKIITGVRRSGKSMLLRSYIDKIKQEQPSLNIIYIDLIDFDNEPLREYHALHEYIQEHYLDGAENMLFVDEVQLCPNFETVINSLHNSGKYDIYITGSNAFLLSSDLATLFTGRYIEIHVYPFSFAEYCEYFSDEHDIDVLFDDYTFKGGFAGCYNYRTERDRIEYVKDVINTIVYRDLIDKYKISDVLVLEHIIDYLMDNISNLTTINKLSNTFKSNNISTNHVTVGKYIKYLCEAFVIYDIKRYDIKGKKILDVNDKYYLCDQGVRFAELGQKSIDYGRVYENMVCIELLRRGYDVFVGKLYTKEVDFIAIKDGVKKYIQVSDNVQDSRTFARECEPLLSIKDGYEKILIARTRHPEGNYEGIKVIDIAQWLKSVR